MTEPTVFIVDDDKALCDGLAWLVETIGLNVSPHTSAQDFLDAYQPGTPGCLLLDLRMPEMGGLELQKELKERGSDLPIIILSGHGDVSTAVHAMKAGAVDFIEKPFSNQLLLERVQNALSVHSEKCASRPIENGRRSSLKRLTHRERDVLEKVVVGKTNKVVARELGISVKTVEFHRSNVMKKMNAYSLADLIEKATSGL